MHLSFVNYFNLISINNEITKLIWKEKINSQLKNKLYAKKFIVSTIMNKAHKVFINYFNKLLRWLLNYSGTLFNSQLFCIWILNNALNVCWNEPLIFNIMKRRKFLKWFELIATTFYKRKYLMKYSLFCL